MICFMLEMRAPQCLTARREVQLARIAESSGRYGYWMTLTTLAD